MKTRQLTVPIFHPSKKRDTKITRFVKEMGTGPTGTEKGASTHVIAVISAVMDNLYVFPLLPKAAVPIL